MKRALTCVFVMFSLIALASVQPGWAQSTDDFEALKEEIETLKEGQAQMQKDLAAIRKILEDAIERRAQARAQAQPKPFEPTELTIGASAVLGEATAPVTLIEYSDYQCPYCQRHFSNVMPDLVKDYVETGKLRYVMREFPIESIHPQAMKASVAALCAKDQGRYWEMHDLIFGNQRQVSADDLKAHGKTLGLDSASFDDCLESDKYIEQIRNDLQEGQKLGVRGTPSFVIGTTDPQDPDKVTATKFIRGAQPLTAFKQAIDELLAAGAEKGS